MDKTTLQYTKQTLECWDEAAKVHAEANRDLAAKVACKSFNSLEQDFNALVDRLPLAGRSVVQICCNNGKDLISIKNKGAGYCLGIDGSHEFVQQAKALASVSAHSDLDFACHNVYEIPQHYTCQFDIAIVTVGVLNWMPDLPGFLATCASLLKPGGYFLMEEIHPVLNMYTEGSPSTLGASYFDRSAQVDDEGLDYFTGKKYSAKENYFFQHTLSDILMAAIEAELALTYIEELPCNVGNYCADLADAPHNPPLAFIVSWQKTLTK
ncbi:class I SAM-dependent methyltransferase [Microbulbifer aggregans]|uniref:class I SAM-dependent methyltransferase n=1 Tax=Microbulbifer aggregans TaxID=1769779 RepID=UPI001CFF146A|nr:class I SAM-dependent methyltransferase [Microbulbifer aggregans]